MSQTETLANATGTPELQASGEAVTLTAAAAQHAAKLLSEHRKNEQDGVRVGVAGGGCSGLQYVIKIGPPRQDDLRFDHEDLPVFVDKKSFLYLRGILIDWTESLMYTGFQFKNPNASHSCSCGTSFTI